MANLRRIHQLPLADRPREKLRARGVQALSDFELLEVCVGSGSSGADVGHIARQIQKLLQRSGSDALVYENLLHIHGVNIATATKLLAAFEWARRQLVHENTPLCTQQDILARLGDIRTKQQEYFVTLSLDGGQRLIALRTIAIGTLNAVLAHPREVFADAVADRAASIVVAHNHPSGDPLPSQQDISLTQQLVAAGQLLGITLRDHIIVTRQGQFSCRQHHML